MDLGNGVFGFNNRLRGFRSAFELVNPFFEPLDGAQEPRAHLLRGIDRDQLGCASAERCSRRITQTERRAHRLRDSGLGAAAQCAQQEQGDDQHAAETAACTDNPAPKPSHRKPGLSRSWKLG